MPAEAPFFEADAVVAELLARAGSVRPGRCSGLFQPAGPEAADIFDQGVDCAGLTLLLKNGRRCQQHGQRRTKSSGI